MVLSATLIKGCAIPTTATTKETICKPWDPIAYNSRNPKSDSYAGSALRPRLAKHNHTGRRLDCWD